MPEDLPILCIGAAHWDVIARAATQLSPGADVPGLIGRRPGGVALNVALALGALDRTSVLLSAIGSDIDGEQLVTALIARGADCSWITRHDGPTDCYLAIEDAEGEVFAAVADCTGLERACTDVLWPLRDGTLATAAVPWRGRIVVDGNLPAAVLDDLAHGPATSGARFAVVPASPGKAARLGALLFTTWATVYLNRREAEILVGTAFPDSRAAAEALRALGIAEAVVTDGPAPVTLANRDLVFSVAPPAVATRSVTGAGDWFLAAHLAACDNGLDPRAALHSALAAATRHIGRHTERTAR